MTVSESTLVDHAVALYGELEARAQIDSAGKLRFEGSKVEAFRACKISQAYYSILFRELTVAGCIEQIRRGDRHHPSIVLLHEAPTHERFSQNYRSALTKPDTIAKLREWVTQLEARIEHLEKEVGVNASQ